MSQARPVAKGQGASLVVLRTQQIHQASFSILLYPEAVELREELAKVAVLSLEEGYVNDSNPLAVMPSIINKELVGPITPVNDCNFLLPLKSRDEVKDLCKLGKFKVMTKDGPCKVLISPWSAELGAVGRASGEGHWVLIWNLPLHAWCEHIIAEVIRPVGELVAVSQAIHPHKNFVSVLVRRQSVVSLPMELDFSMGMRRYNMIFTDERLSFPVYRKELSRYVIGAGDAVAGVGSSVGDRTTKENEKRSSSGASAGSVNMVVVEPCSHRDRLGTEVQRLK